MHRVFCEVIIDVIRRKKIKKHSWCNTWPKSECNRPYKMVQKCFSQNVEKLKLVLQHTEFRSNSKQSLNELWPLSLTWLDFYRICLYNGNEKMWLSFVQEWNNICVLCRMELHYSNRQTLADLALGVATWTKRVARRICSSSTKPRKREDNDLLLELSEVLDDWLSIEHRASHGKSLMDPTLFERLGDNALKGRLLPHSVSDVGMDIGLGKRWLFS